MVLDLQFDVSHCPNGSQLILVIMLICWDISRTPGSVTANESPQGPTFHIHMAHQKKNKNLQNEPVEQRILGVAGAGDDDNTVGGPLFGNIEEIQTTKR